MSRRLMGGVDANIYWCREYTSRPKRTETSTGIHSIRFVNLVITHNMKTSLAFMLLDALIPG